MKKILTGVKPTGKLTLGNYLGVLKRLKKLSEDKDNFLIFFVADLHSLTLPIESNELTQNSKDIVAFLLATGFHYENNCVFLQSSVSEHAQMNSILSNFFYMGELSRMTQYKDWVQKNKNVKELSTPFGVLAYPTLMASDILLYGVEEIPVGQDQVQHVELTRDIADRLNKRYKKKLFILPKAVIGKNSAKIMSLSDPTKKMSKSDPKGDIFLVDDEKTITKKIMSAVTDLETSVKYDPIKKPGISNLMNIYSSFTEKSFEEIEKEFSGKGYGEFKKAVAKAVCDELIPLQKKRDEILKSGLIEKVLKEGKIKAKTIAKENLKILKKEIGLVNID